MLTNLTDIHCHILPGVDDGAQTTEEALQMLRMEYAQGVRNIILTPHFRRNMFETPAEVIEKTFNQFKKMAESIGNDLSLYCGCEFHVNEEMTSVLESAPARRMAGTKYVLTEFPGRADYEYIRTITYRLQQYGYRPVVAHIERCPNLWSGDYIKELVNRGVFIQVNASAVIGEDGRKIKKFCRHMIEDGLVHFVASDSHNLTDRAPNLGQCSLYIFKKFGESTAERLLVLNPRKLLANEYI